MLLLWMSLMFALVIPCENIWDILKMFVFIIIYYLLFIIYYLLFIIYYLLWLFIILIIINDYYGYVLVFWLRFFLPERFCCFCSQIVRLWFNDAPIFLFLNKVDLFEKKIQEKDLSITFPSYKGFFLSLSFSFFLFLSLFLIAPSLLNHPPPKKRRKKQRPCNRFYQKPIHGNHPFWKGECSCVCHRSNWSEEYGAQLVRNEERKKRKKKSKTVRFYFRERRHNRQAEKRDFQTSHLNYFSQLEFRKRYRMSKECFLELYDELKEGLKLKSRHQEKNLFVIPPITKVAMMLRFMAGGDLVDIGDIFGYHPQSVYRAVNQVIDAVIDHPTLGKCEFRAFDREWLKKKGDLFCEKRQKNPFASKCVGAIDGLAIKIHKPPKKDGPTDYSNRKGFHAIVCQGLCDANKRFLFFSSNATGSTHDSVAFSMSQLFPTLCHGLPGEYFVAADNAYPLIGSLMKPFQGKNRANVFEDSYNYHLSSLRVVIENAFGILMQRWGLFWRKLRISPARASKFISAGVKLHNFIVDFRCSMHKIWLFGSSMRNAMVQHLDTNSILRPSS